MLSVAVAVGETAGVGAGQRRQAHAGRIEMVHRLRLGDRTSDWRRWVPTIYLYPQFEGVPAPS